MAINEEVRVLRPLGHYCLPVSVIVKPSGGFGDVVLDVVNFVPQTSGVGEEEGETLYLTSNEFGRLL